MKKSWKRVMLAAFTAVCLTTGTGLARDVSPDNILWKYAGDLSPALGTTQNIGVAGVLSGESNGYVIAGGGANFPQGGPLVGGPKKTYPDVYVFKVNGDKLDEVDHAKMPFEVGYGASASDGKGIYYVGGSTSADGAKQISYLSAGNNGKLQIEKTGSLPFTFQNGAAAVYQGKLYVGVGKQDGKLSQKFYSFDLKTKQVTQLADFPGAAREQVVYKVLGDKLFVFSGGSSIAYTDGYAYDFASNSWSKMADVSLGRKGISLLGANSVKLNNHEMLVIGGFNKEVYDNAVANLGSLKDEALKTFKAGYFGADPEDFHWNKEILIYDASTNTWRTVGQVPFYAPCGEGLVLSGNRLISINGEIKPGVRSPRMYMGYLGGK